MCQSCGMPIKKDEVKGTEKDGSLSQKYCNLCYKDGEFIGADCSLEKMQEISYEAMVKKGFQSFLPVILLKNKFQSWRDGRNK
jgi:hypothetical protein